MVVVLHVGDAGHVLAVANAVADADDLEELVSALVLAHPNLVADLHICGRGLDAVQERAEPQVLGHRLVEGAKHLVEVVIGFLARRVDVTPAPRVPVLVVVGLDTVDDLPTVDDVYAVVALVAESVEPVYAEAQGAPEEVAHHLGHPRPSVAIARWRAIPLKLAVLEERLYRVTAAVPVEIERQILVRSGDDCPISHFDDLPKVSAGALCPRLVARDLHAVPASCKEESGFFTKAYKAATCTSVM